MQRCTILITLLTVGGLLILVAGLTIHWIVPSLIDNQISKAVVLENGTQTYAAWLDPPAPVYIEFYFFNITNAEEVMNHNNVKPNLTQIGPFTYKELRYKTDVEIVEDGAFIDYKQKKYYIYERDMSSGPEDQWFIGLNLPMLTVANMLESKLSFGQKFGLNVLLTLNGVHLFQNYTVKAYLWGYTDPFFAMAKDKLTKFGYEEMAENIPDEVGLFTGAKGNGSSDGVWRISTGKTDITQLNQIVSWKGESSVDYWNTEFANRINGTDAAMWHPHIKKSEELYMFSSEICRSGSVEFQKDVVHKGLNLYRFALSKKMMAGVDRMPQNADFCTPPGNCLKEGVLNMSVCMNGAPVIMSQPHFSGAHPDYINGVHGMRPDPELTTKLDIDPKTGAVLHAIKHLQFNAYISPLETFPDTLEMNATIYPLMWVNETGGITDVGAYHFKKAVYGPMCYVNIVSYSLMAVGALLLVCVIFLVACRTIRKVTKREDLSVVFNKDGVSKKDKGLDPTTQVSLMNRPTANGNKPTTNGKQTTNNPIYKGNQEPPATVTALLQEKEKDRDPAV